MLDNIYLHQNEVELNFQLIGMASEPVIGRQINLHTRDYYNFVMLCVPYSDMAGIAGLQILHKIGIMPHKK